MSKLSKDTKFEFDPEFQQAILQYTLTDRNGHKALKLFDDTFFTLIEHQVIAKAIKTYFKRKKKLPQDKIYLKEEIRQLLTSRDYSKYFQEKEREDILKLVSKLYSTPVKDGDELLLKIAQFNSYCRLKDTLERVNLQDFNQYENFAAQVQKAIAIHSSHKSDAGTWLLADLEKRQAERSSEGDIFPTPWRQLNKISSSHRGYDKSIVGVIIGPEKKFKTGVLVNLARGYLKLRKRILYVDLENGQNSLALRMEQSISRKEKGDVLSGEYNEQIKKIFRKYKRLGSDIDIKRFPAYSTTALDIEAYMDKQYREHGIKYDGMIIDYVGLMGSISGQKDDTQRISDAYIDIKNLTERKDLEITWTANHITREAKKRIASRYEPNDTAKCIDINRHVDLMLGVNYTEEEYEQGVMRLELIQQRDGESEGRIFTWVDRKTQHVKEFSKSEVDKYYEHVRSLTEEEHSKRKKTASDA